MPALVPLTPIDVRDRLAALLAGNALISENFVNPIKRRDPGTASAPSDPTDFSPENLAGGVTLCLAVPGLGLSDDTLGGNGFGTDTKVIQLALIVYVWQPTEFRASQDVEAIKQQCGDLCIVQTTLAVEAARQYQVDPTPEGGYWYKSDFARQPKEAAKAEIATTFHTPDGKYHVSLTPINFYCQVMRSVPRSSQN